MTDDGEHPLLLDEEAPRGPRVVAAVDTSAGSRAALLFALRDAQRRGVAVEAVHVYRPPEYWMDFYAVSTHAPDQLRKQAVERIGAFVDEVVAEFAGEGPQPPPEVRVRAVMGLPADALIRESRDAELLVVGSRGHGGFAAMLLGSTSLQCAQHASCPVTVVHSPESHHHRLWLHRDRDRDGREASNS